MSTQTEPEIIKEQFQNQNGKSNWTFLMIFWHTFSRTEFDRSRPLAASSEGSSGSIRACSVLEKSIGLSSLSNIPNETKTEQKQRQFRPCQCLKLHVTSAWTTAWCVCVGQRVCPPVVFNVNWWITRNFQYVRYFFIRPIESPRARSNLRPGAPVRGLPCVPSCRYAWSRRGRRE